MPVVNPQEPQETPQESVKTKGKNLNEDIYKTSNEGEVIVPVTDVDNIQTLEDLVDYLSNLSGWF